MNQSTTGSSKQTAFETKAKKILKLILKLILIEIVCSFSLWCFYSYCSGEKYTSKRYRDYSDRSPVKIELSTYDPVYAQACVQKKQNLDSELEKLEADLVEKTGSGSITTSRAKAKYQCAVAHEENPVNGYIDFINCQGYAGDCWLLGPISALSETPYGAETIHAAMNINENGNLEVYLRGPNQIYELSQEDLINVKRGEGFLSFGDSDMQAFELAAKRFREDIEAGRIVADPGLPKYLFQTGKPENLSILDYGESRQGYWLIAGLVDNDTAQGTDSEKIQELLDRYRQNPTHSVMDMSFLKNRRVKDIHGERTTISSGHEYWVSELTDTSITLREPGLTNIAIELDLDTFLQLPIEELIYLPIGMG